tara:strand:- start:614 stop:943 length:330 start_codon:yes stop_codon:yes gene_type:complete
MTKDLDPKAAEVTRDIAHAKGSPEFSEQVPTKDLFAKPTPKVRPKSKAGGLSGLLGGIPMNLTITLNDSDKEWMADLLSQKVNTFLLYWRIAITVMAVGVTAGIVEGLL